jgi:hypothetical protein
LIVEWNGREYDVDPTELTQRELDQIEQKTGLTWKSLVTGGLNCEANAIRALFWVVERRDSKDLTFGDYDGPPLKVWLPHLPAFKAISDDLGKQLTSVFGDSGSGSSPSDVDTPPPSTTG